MGAIRKGEGLEDDGVEEGGAGQGGPKDDPVPSQFGALWSDPPPFNVSWSSISCESHSGPAHDGHGTYHYRLSPSGDIAAMVVNEQKAKKTRVHFLSPFFPEELSSTVYPQDSTDSGR